MKPPSQSHVQSYKHVDTLLKQVRQCTLCLPHLPHGVRPVLQLHPRASILIAGQAPGSKVHASGIPFNDASGDRLRQWMGITPAIFYDATKIAILPMGFCYPGTGKSGDLPPRSECASTWRKSLLSTLENIALTLVIGQYAIDWHLGDRQKSTLTDTVRAWQEYLPHMLVLPHPSPRNNIWLKKNSWFERESIPVLQQRVAQLLH